MALPPCSLAVFDTETTGVIPRVHHVIEFASLRADAGKETSTWESLFSAPESIPPLVQVLTRIRPADVEGKPRCAESLEQIAEQLANTDLLVGQNLRFDLDMLRGEGLDLQDRAWIDTSLLAALVFPEFRSYSLPYMSATLGLPHAPAHRALGDVRATTALLGAIWDRLQGLSAADKAIVRDAFGRGPAGYRILADCLSSEDGEGAPWRTPQTASGVPFGSDESASDVQSKPGSVILQEQDTGPHALDAALRAAQKDPLPTWIAVKNIDATLERHAIPDGVRVLHPPALLLNHDAVDALRDAETLRAEEATLLIKIQWFAPRTRNDIAIHGGEKDVWNGKLACTATSAAYVEQCTAPAHITLLDHWQLLRCVQPESPSALSIPDDVHIVIDDASMLEDTATKALGFFCSLDDLRAAASNDEELERLADILTLWLERLRNGTDVYELTTVDLQSEESQGVRERIEHVTQRTDIPEKTRDMLVTFSRLCDPAITDGRIVWCERRYDGKLTLQAMPLRVDASLQQLLYDRFGVTLLTPTGIDGRLPGIVPSAYPVISQPALGGGTVSVVFPEGQTLSSLLRDPPAGKTIVLAGSKRVIEQAYIEHTESLESKGVTLICQGMNGGMGRMEAEFSAAPAPAILVMTPFFYEGSSLKPNTADRLVLDVVPFDHPNHTVIAKRKQLFGNGFTDYLLPRAEFRLFRLIRSFCRHCTPQAEVWITDTRISQKDYGRRLRSYLEQCASSVEPAQTPTQTNPPDTPQLSLFS